MTRLIDADALSKKVSSTTLFIKDAEVFQRMINDATTIEPSGDLISREDAMGAVQDHFNNDGFKGYDDGQKMMDRIKALPSVSAERVVRCKDCEYAEVKEEPIKGMWCTRFGLHDMAVGDNCFCSWAERREP